MERAAKNERTERRLREAAAEAFAQQGFDGASMDAIAAAAGLSKGALYYRFAAKEELFEAVVESAVRERTAAIAAFLDRPAAAGPQAAVQHLTATVRGDERWAGLLAQCLVRARRDDRFAKRFAAHMDGLRDAIAGVLAERARTAGGAEVLSSERLAAVVSALATGLTLELSGRRAGEAAGTFTFALSLLFSGVGLAERAARPKAS